MQAELMSNKCNYLKYECLSGIELENLCVSEVVVANYEFDCELESLLEGQLVGWVVLLVVLVDCYTSFVKSYFMCSFLDFGTTANRHVFTPSTDVPPQGAHVKYQI